MHLPSGPGRTRESGQIVFLLVILLAIAGGGYWLLHSSRASAREGSRDFVQEMATRVAVQHDRKFLDQRLSPRAQVAHPPVWRERMMERLKSFGTPMTPVEVTGEVRFTSGFFSPVGVYKAQLNYPGMPAYLDLTVTQHSGRWLVEEINLRYYLPPQ